VPFPRDLGKYHQSKADGFSESDGGTGGSARRAWWVLTQSDYVLERVSSASSLPGYQPGLLPVLPAAMSNTPSPVEHILGSHISVVSHNGMPYEGRLHNVSLDDKSGVMQHGKRPELPS
jgi:hypothetical protein